MAPISSRVTPLLRVRWFAIRAGRHVDARTSEPPGEPIKEQVDDRRGVKSQDLADDETTHDGDSERPSQLRADAGSESKRQAAEESRHGRHHDGPETQQAGLIDRVERRLTAITFGFKGKVDHHDGVFLDDAYQQNDANQRDDVEVFMADEESEDGADAGGRQCRQDRDRVDVAFIQDAEDDIDDNESGDDEPD